MRNRFLTRIALVGAIALLFPPCSIQDDDAGPGAAAVTLNVSPGFWNFTDVECHATAQGVPLVQLLLSTGGGGAVRVRSLVVHAQGTVADDDDIADLILAVDADGDGRYATAGGDFALATAGGGFDGDDGSVRFTLQRGIAAGSSERWVVVADLSGTAAGGTWLRASLAAADVGAFDLAGLPASVSASNAAGPRVEIPVQPPAWSLVAPLGTPAARYGHAAVYDPAGDRMVVFGGTDGFSSFNDTAALVLTAGAESWTALAPSGAPPPPRNRMAFFHDAAANRMGIFGGASASTLHGDLWFLSLAPGAESWSSPAATGAPPSARYGAFGACGAGTTKALICGGNSAAAANPHLSDVFELELASVPPAWAAVGPTLPAGYSQSAQAGFQESGGTRTWMFGGQSNASVSMNRLYLLDRGFTQPSLLERTVAGAPLPVAWAAGCWHPTWGRFLVSGGFEYSQGLPVADLFAFDPSTGGRWILLMPDGPSPGPLCMHTLVFDPVRGRVVCFGGQTYSAPSWTAVADAWELR